MKERKISLAVIREANRKLIARDFTSTNVISNDSKDGNISFKARFYGNIYNVNITKEQIKEAYGKALEQSMLK